MAYIQNKIRKSRLVGIQKLEGESIETKVERIVSNKEPINDGAPEIFTERKEGVIAAMNVRTDRWEIAADAMDAVTRSTIAKRDGKGMTDDELAAKMEGATHKEDVGEAKTIQGTEEV